MTAANKPAKTQSTAVDVKSHLEKNASPEQKADCPALIAMMSRATGETPKMWGASIIGFGSYHYRYDSGRQGDACLTGFAIRKNEFAIYLAPDSPARSKWLAKLGKHKAATGCIYIKRLADIDTQVLEALIVDTVSLLRSRYPQVGTSSGE